MSPRATARQRPTPPPTVHVPRQDTDETADLSGHAEETADLSGAESRSGHAGGGEGRSGHAEETAELSGLIGSRAGRPETGADSERRRPRTGLAFGAIGLAVLVAAGAGTVAARRALTTTAGWTAARPVSTGQADVVAQAAPSPSPSDVALPARYTVPGTPPAIPWPTTGQAALRVLGVGSLGATPDQSQVPIASVAKAMTAYVVLHDHPLSTGRSGPTLTVTAAEAAAYPGEVALGQSLVKVTAGEVLTERQALDALMLPSADDVALILARWDAGSVSSFVGRMNAMAATLGMTHTDYTDPSGYEPSTVSTANDQVLLAARAMQVPAFAQIVAQRSASVPLAGTVHNYNTLLGSDGVTGIKTGSTSAAGGCLLFAASYQVGGTTLTIVGATFGQHGSTMYGLPQALDESRTLIQTAQQALVSFPLIAAGQTVVTVHGMNLAATGTLTVVGWPGMEFRTHLHASANLRHGAGAGTLDLDGPESHQTADLTVQ